MSWCAYSCWAWRRGYGPDWTTSTRGFLFCGFGFKKMREKPFARIKKYIYSLKVQYLLSRGMRVLQRHMYTCTYVRARGGKSSFGQPGVDTVLIRKALLHAPGLDQQASVPLNLLKTWHRVECSSDRHICQPKITQVLLHGRHYRHRLASKKKKAWIGSLSMRGLLTASRLGLISHNSAACSCWAPIYLSPPAVDVK